METSPAGLFRHADNERVRLPDKQFDIIRYFVENAGETLTKDVLMEKFFGGGIVEENNLNQAVSAIRKILSESPGENKYIQTVPGIGYRFVARVDVLDGSESPAAAGTASHELPATAVDEGALPTGPVAGQAPAITQPTGADVPDETGHAGEPPERPALSADSSAGPRSAPFDDAAVGGAETETEAAPAAELSGLPRTPSDDTRHQRGLEGARGVAASIRHDPVTNREGGVAFERWLSNPLSAVLLFCIAGAVIASAAQLPDYKRAMRYGGGAQGVAILIMLLASFFIRAKVFRRSEECDEADVVSAGFKSKAEFEKVRNDLAGDLRKFVWWWRALLLSWVPLYLFYALEGYEVHRLVFNLINTLLIATCYYILNKNEEKQDEHIAGWFVNFVMLVIIIVPLAVLLLNKQWDDANILAGVAAGITMALFVGRLQSRFLGPRFGVVYLLYSYTAIQPLVLYIDLNPGWGWIILDFALLLKCLLYLYIAWLLQSGLLLFYFASVRRADETLLRQREAFSKLLQDPRKHNFGQRAETD